MRFDDLPPFLRIEQAQELTQLGRYGNDWRLPGRAGCTPSTLGVRG